MKRLLFLAGGISLAIAGGASAQSLPFSDGFESASASGTYQPWTGASQSTLALEANHPHSGTQSARAFATNPGGWSDTYTMTSGTAGINGGITSSVWVWDDNSVTQSGSTPVNAMLAFAGANGTTTPGFGGDYAELGLISGNTAPNGLTDWVIRVASYDAANGTTWFDTGVPRTQGFFHLQITADPLPSAGGDGLYHFFINGTDVTPAVAGGLARNNVGLEWNRIGSNSSSNQDFWYDDYSVAAVPEPACLGLIGMGLAGLLIRRRRA
ncbi:MAG TPA: PEP-CTERM sorting domain-containing protein [Tepidisphaeraceae bacterium]|jgi:hypothetical protein|nr:PEP-CTERM sorting domain-containing protein [Tepidisphaeraceae bacterium]